MGREGGQAGAFLGEMEGAGSPGEVIGEGVETDLQFHKSRGSARGPAHLIAQGLDGGADLVGVFRGERELLAVDLNGIAIDVRRDLAESFGGDAGDFREAEVGVAELLVLADEAVGVLAGEAGVILTKFFPGETERIEQFGIANLLEALRASGGTTAGDGGEGLLEAHPGAEVYLFFGFHEEIWETIVSEFGE